MSTPESAEIDLTAALAGLLARAWGRPVRIEKLGRLSGGASRESWAFDAVDERGARSALILRRDFPPGATPSLETLVGESDAFDRRGEFELFRALAEAGIPVPRPVAFVDEESGLADAFVMERVEGEALPRKLLRDPIYAGARERMADQVAEVLARIHGLDPGGLPSLPTQPTAKQIDLCRGMVDLGPAPRPVFELAHRWLTEHRPPDPARLALVHGDFRTGNFLVGPDGLRAVLDWEYAHLGDPMEDLGFLCLKPWRFGHLDRAAGGFGTRGAFTRAYERTSGDPVDPEHVRFWEILGNLKWGALCVARAMLHVKGTGRSVEVAAIGRRVAETELDLLELIE